VVFAHLGARRAQWESLFEYIHAEHPDFTGQWRYYNDGKSWLMNVSRRRRPLLLSVLEHGFRITSTSPTGRGDIKASTLSAT